LVTEDKAMAIEEIHTYCPMCIAQCGVIAVVEDGRFTRVRPDPEHPNGGICIKGSAAPELVYAPDRLKYPMKRTRPKGDADPGWVEISWEEALDTVASRLLQIKAESGPEAVVFRLCDAIRQCVRRVLLMDESARSRFWQSEPALSDSHLHVERHARIQAHVWNADLAAGFREYALHFIMGRQPTRDLSDLRPAH
jgi:hypothetical protein